MPDIPACQSKPDRIVITQQSKDSTNRRHADYYFEDVVVFQVEDMLFKVPRRKLRSCSPVFDSLFTLPENCDPSAPSEGMSDELPIVLPQVSALDFERLLTYMYPLGDNYLSTSENFSENWTFDYLRSILKLSERFVMDNIYQEAIQALNRKGRFPDEVTKIQFGMEFKHLPWTQEGFSQLITRDAPLNIEEARRIGFEDAFRCMAAWQTYRPQARYDDDDYYYGRRNSDPMEALKKHFGDDGDKLEADVNYAD